MITASHNPYRWNGMKFKASYGSSALPSIVAQIEEELAAVLRDGVPALPPRVDLIHSLDVRAPYLETIEKLVDWERLRSAGLRFVSDPQISPDGTQVVYTVAWVDETDRTRYRSRLMLVPKRSVCTRVVTSATRQP